MSIWTIADLHLSFCVDKPMNIFGDNWDNYEDVCERTQNGQSYTIRLRKPQATNIPAVSPGIRSEYRT